MGYLPYFPFFLQLLTSSFNSSFDIANERYNSAIFKSS